MRTLPVSISDWEMARLMKASSVLVPLSVTLFRVAMTFTNVRMLPWVYSHEAMALSPTIFTCSVVRVLAWAESGAATASAMARAAADVLISNPPHPRYRHARGFFNRKIVFHMTKDSTKVSRSPLHDGESQPPIEHRPPGAQPILEVLLRPCGHGRNGRLRTARGRSGDGSAARPVVQRPGLQWA